MEACNIKDETSADPVWKQWHEYRATCFLNVATTQVWIYTATDEFDCLTAMMHLREVPGASLDAGSHAINISAFGDFHVVPISRLTSWSLELLQPNVEANLHKRKVELLQGERCALSSLREETMLRYPNILRPRMGGKIH